MSFGTSLDEKMETYYQRFIDLQEKLRKSEEDRLKLELKFNDMLQISREEERSHYRKLRSQYKRFLDEDRKRQERNEKILRTLERIESRISLLTSKTERFKCLRRQYKSYLQRVNQQTEASHLESIEGKYHLEETYNPLQMKSAMKKSDEDKLEILEKYLRSLNSHKKEKYYTEAPKAPNYEEDLKKLDTFSKNLKEGFDSNKANSIAEEIMNSIYSRHYKKEDGNKKPKSKFSIYEDNSDYDDDRDNNYNLRRDQNQTQSDKRPEDTLWKSLKSDQKHVRIKETDYGIQKIYDRTEHEGQDLPVNDNEENHLHNEKHIGEPQLGIRNYKELNGHEVHESVAKATDYRNVPNIYPNDLSQSEATNDDIPDIENSKQEHSPPEDLIPQQENMIEHNMTDHDANLQIDQNKKQCEANSSDNVVRQVARSQNEDQNVDILDEQGIIQKEQSDNAISGEMNCLEINKQGQHLNQTVQLTERFEQCDEQKNPLQYDNNTHNIETAGQSQAVHSNVRHFDEPVQKRSNDQQYARTSNDQPYDKSELQYDENGHITTQYGEIQQHDGKSNDQQYIRGNEQPIGKYDEYDHVTQQYTGSQLQNDENGQPIAQYDEKGQLVQQYQEGDSNTGQFVEDQFQYDEYGQPTAQCDGNGQPIEQYRESDPNVAQYAEGQLQYDENGQPIAQYDENGQLIQQYQGGDPNVAQYAEGQLQYDENGQPIAQYDEKGQQIQKYQEGEPNVEQYAGGQLQYDKNGQPIAQYDENGQQIQQYQRGDPNVEQYVEGQLQYDENGQPIAQYDENGQQIQQYQGDDLNVEQYDEGQLQYDENGQPIAQYDENGQLIQQYQGDDPNVEQYATGQLQYDENGQPIAQYDENGQQIQQYQGGDPSVEQYAEGRIQYDKNGQPIAQYDENGQQIQQYQGGDPSVEQYAEGQIQYDENGQPIAQYDNNGQLIQQYQGGDPSVEQYAEGQIQYDENGQPIAQYDNNGQLIQQYDAPNTSQYPGSQIQYDENGQPIGLYGNEQYNPNEQYYDENGQPVNYSEASRLYDGNGQLIQLHNESGQQLEQQFVANREVSELEDKEQAFGEKVDITATPHSKLDTKEESKEFNVLELLETDTDVSVKENTSKISNDSDFDFSNA